MEDTLVERVVRWLRYQNRRRLIKRRLARDPHAFIEDLPPRSFELPVRESSQVDPATIRLDTSEQPEITILIPAYGQAAVTLRCLASLQLNPPSSSYEVIVVEDASGDAGADAVGRVQGVRFVINERNLGFLRSCNAAARLARGAYLLLLNNDTQVLPGAVDALRAGFARWPAAGIVGAKLVYPDGRLQEAGGIVWRDGSAWNVGRNGDPADPAWNYVREVDYISGAAIMVERALWQHLGGFDERFAPAYYEDTDLAMQVRQAGRQVIYEPRAEIVHLEGVSSGTDANPGIKKHQYVNAGVFRDKWSGVLERDHLPNDPAQVPVARDRLQLRPLVLVTNDVMATPDLDAGSRAIVQAMQAMVELGCVVKFWPVNRASPVGYAEALRAMGIDVLAGSARPAFEDWLRIYGPRLRSAVLNRPEHAMHFLREVRRRSAARIVYVGHDLHFARLAAQAEVQGEPRLRAASDALLSVEQALWDEADVSVYFSDEEVEAVRSRRPRAAVRALQAYCFEPAAVPEPATPGQHIVFVAGFGHPPNVDAAQWLVQQVMPSVWQAEPAATLSLVGSKPTAEVLALAAPRVEVTGWVSDADLHQHYARSRVAVVPLRFGAGVKHKVVEALARGTPLVTTSVGAQGLPGLDRVCRVADEAQELAAHVVTLLRDDDAWRAAASAGAGYVHEHFSAASLRAQMGQLLGLS